MRSELKTAATSVIVSIMLFATAQLSVGSAAKSGPHRHWSIDLTDYWPLKTHQGESAPFTDAYLAADKTSVAVALESGDPSHGPWKSSILVFDANTGKLRQQCGPWDGQMIAGFSATASGNFLVTSEPFLGARNAAAKLSLLSPSCTELQNLALSTAKGNGQNRWNVLLSPSRRTLLTADTTRGTVSFTIRDADTFAVHFEWQEPESDEMRAASVSDAGVLALKPKKSSSVGFGPAEIFYRAFGTTTWHNVTDTLASANRDVFAAFLTNDTFLEAAEVGELEICYPTQEGIELRRITGQLISSKTIAKRAHAIDVPLVGSVAASVSGRYFGSVLRISNVGWFWCNTDMRLEHYYLYVWSSSALTPVAIVRLGLVFPPLPLAIAPDGTWFAAKKGNIISVRPLVPSR